MIGSDIARSTRGFAELGPGPKITLRGTVSGSYRSPFVTSFTNLNSVRIWDCCGVVRINDA